ncbi:hypothetical protein [Arthrobacter sp. CAU 1506]|uniref:hypothetical protein n=1 Tax=Arthrobacter sp. CAU 1506 TaxID=2560052 RepID=UPI00197A8DBA|nr:hypothetical protein [Arthrobacter sp. CAU 1506]
MSTPGKRPGPAQDRWYPADAGRLLGAVLVPVSWLVAGWPAAAAMFLVVGGQWLLRWYLMGRPADAVGQTVLLAAGWFSAVGLYHQVAWLDAVMHVLASLVVALLVAELLRGHLLRMELPAQELPATVLPEGRGTPTHREMPAAVGAAPGIRRGHGGWTSAVVPAVLLVCATVTLGVLWELGEWLGHTYITPEIGVGYDDTIGDLAANLAGAVLGAAIAVRSTRAAHGHSRRAAPGPLAPSRTGHRQDGRRRGAAVPAGLTSGSRIVSGSGTGSRVETGSRVGTGSRIGIGTGTTGNRTAR